MLRNRTTYFNTAPVPFPTSYFPTYDSGSLHNFNQICIQIFSPQIFIETVWKQVDFNLEPLNVFSYSDPYSNFFIKFISETLVYPEPEAEPEPELGARLRFRYWSRQNWYGSGGSGSSDETFNANLILFRRCNEGFGAGNKIEVMKFSRFVPSKLLEPSSAHNKWIYVLWVTNIVSDIPTTLKKAGLVRYSNPGPL